MDAFPDVLKLLESLMPEKPAFGWSNEGMLEILSEFLSENPQAASDLYEYFKSFDDRDVVDNIVKGTIAACLVEYDKEFHQDVKDFLSRDGWSQADFDDYDAYRGR